MRVSRTSWMLLLVALVALVALHAHAADWPLGPVRIIVGGAPASGPDLVARMVAERLGPSLGQAVVVENRPGAGGQLAMAALVHSRADGHTLALATMSQAVFNSYLFPALAYDPLRDLQPVTTLVTGAMAIAVHPSFPTKTFSELVEHAKAEPNELVVAMGGNGSPPHLVYLMLEKKGNFKMRAVLYRSGPDALNAVLSGQLQILMEGPALIAPQVAAGKLRALLVTGDRREPTLPRVPTAAELGMQVRGEAWMGLVAPVGTPRWIVARVSQETARIFSTSEVEAQAAKLGFRVYTSSPDAFGQLIRDDHTQWGAAIRELGLKLAPE